VYGGSHIVVSRSGNIRIGAGIGAEAHSPACPSDIGICPCAAALALARSKSCASLHTSSSMAWVHRSSMRGEMRLGQRIAHAFSGLLN